MDTLKRGWRAPGGGLRYPEDDGLTTITLVHIQENRSPRVQSIPYSCHLSPILVYVCVCVHADIYGGHMNLLIKAAAAMWPQPPLLPMLRYNVYLPSNPWQAGGSCYDIPEVS